MHSLVLTFSLKFFFNYFLETYQYNHPKQFLTTIKFAIDSNLCKKKVRLNSVNYAKTIELKKLKKRDFMRDKITARDGIIN